jgi:DNA polymerase/3'-5' exonuclease PolX
MTDDKARIPLEQALTLALEVVGMLGDCTERIAIGGSIRRGKAEIGDIEIVAKPRYVGKRNLLDERMNRLRDQQTFALRMNKNGHNIAWGDRYKAAWFKGFALDVFIVLNDRQWGPTMVIRTGPGDANGALVTAKGAINKAFDVTGVCPQGIKFEHGALWGEGGAPFLDTPEEEDVFAALGMAWLPPHLRTPMAYWRQAFRRCTPPKVEMMLEWGELATKSHLASYPPLLDALYLPNADGVYEAKVIAWGDGCGPRASEAEVIVEQLDMFGKMVSYG